MKFKKFKKLCKVSTNRMTMFDLKVAFILQALKFVDKNLYEYLKFKEFKTSTIKDVFKEIKRLWKREKNDLISKSYIKNHLNPESSYKGKLFAKEGAEYEFVIFSNYAGHQIHTLVNDGENFVYPYFANTKNTIGYFICAK